MEFTEEQKSIIVKYDKILQEYLEHPVTAYENSLENHRTKHKEFFDEILKLYHFTEYICEMYITPNLSEHQQIIREFLVKASQTTLSIHHCLFNGLVLDAATLCRSLMELSINVSLIVEKDLEIRLELYKNIYHVQKYFAFKENVFETSPQEKEEIIKKYNLYKDNYRNKNPKQWAWSLFKDKLNGREPTLFHICEYLGDHQLGMYKNLYNILSNSVHSNSGMYAIAGITYDICAFTAYYCSEIYLQIAYCLKIKNYDEICFYFSNFSVILNDSKES